MRSNSDHSRLNQALFISGKWSVQRLALTGDVDISEEGPLMHFLDPNGEDRNITLPPLRAGFIYVVHHVGADNNLNIWDANANLLTTLNHRQSAEISCSDVEWNVSRTWDDIDIFGGAGPNHSPGLVPDPGPVVQALRFLREDGVWAEAMDDGNVDAFKYVTDGTTTAEATGGDTLRFRSADSSLSVSVQNNDGTYGDNVNLQVDETNVDHDALLNFVADEHVAHTGVTISGASNGGLSGGGDIAASRTLSIAPLNLAAATPVLGDVAIIGDASDSTNPKRTTFTALNAIFVHNNLVGYEANRHVDHTTVSIVAGLGLSGGGDISASRTLNLDLSNIDDGVISGDDVILFDNVSGVFKATFLDFNTMLDHNVLVNYEANQHVDHSTVSVSAGTGLTGGGTIAANRTIELNAASIASLAKADSALQAAAIGVSIQGYDADLTTWAGISPSANAQSLVSAANYAAMRALLDLEAGTDFLSPAAISAAYQPLDADILKADVSDNLDVGFTSISYNAGTKTTGTYTPDPTLGNFQQAINGGAHTLAPPGSTCSICIQYTNNASAGAITTSGFTKVTGDVITTTNGHDFFMFITRNNGFTHLHVQALQ